MSHRQLFASGETIREQKDEIARLHAEIDRLRLTDAEGAAIRFALGRLSGTLRGNEECGHYDALARLLTK